FFQAEDGIRDGHVTGVQTCALPIFYSNSRERHASGSPDKRIDEGPLRGREANNIRRNVIWLDHILRILASRLTPPAGFYIHLSVRSGVVPARDVEHRCRLQLRDVVNDEAVRTVAEAAREVYLRARPSCRILCNAKMEEASLVNPCVRWFVQIP